MEPEVQINDYKIFRCHRNRHGGGVACYIRNYLSYNIISVFPREIESVCFEILLPNSKPIKVGTIYRTPNEIYILGNFNINLS